MAKLWLAWDAPSLPELNFATMSFTYAWAPNAIFLTVTTNNPCHLLCYWTDIQPGKHPRSRVIRGLTVPWSTYFCFVSWHTVEQIEAGDTLTHTFLLTSWTFCQTRWLLFQGTVGPDPSPSTSPIFQVHNNFILEGAIISNRDNYMNAHFLNQHTNYGSFIAMLVSHYLTSLIAKLGLISFDVSRLYGTTIVNATMTLTLFSISGIGDTHFVYRLLHTDWQELYSSYNLRFTGQRWNSGDFSSTDFTTTDASSAIIPASGTLSWDITAIVQHALDNHINVSLTIMGVFPASFGPSYCTHEHPTPSKRPSLTIVRTGG